MKRELDKLYNKVEKIDEKLDTVNTHLAVYNEQLIIHIKRTDLLEKELKPVVEHVSKVKLILNILMTVLSSSAAVGIIYKLIEAF